MPTSVPSSSPESTSPIRSASTLALTPCAPVRPARSSVAPLSRIAASFTPYTESASPMALIVSVDASPSTVSNAAPTKALSPVLPSSTSPASRLRRSPRLRVSDVLRTKLSIVGGLPLSRYRKVKPDIACSLIWMREPTSLLTDRSVATFLSDGDGVIARGFLAQLVQGVLLDLAHALGAHAEPVPQLAEGQLRGVEPIVTAHDRALAVGERLEQARQLLDPGAQGDVLVGILRAGVGEQVSEAAGVALLAVDRLLERPRPAFGRDEMVDVLAGETGEVCEVLEARLRAVRLREPAAGGLDPRELSDRAVREQDRPHELAHELLHRLTDPPARVRPERRAARRVVALERAQQPDRPILHQLGVVDGCRSCVGAGHARDERAEGVDQGVSRVGVALRGDDQIELAERRVPGPWRRGRAGRVAGKSAHAARGCGRDMAAGAEVRLETMRADAGPVTTVTSGLGDSFDRSASGRSPRSVPV